MHKTAYDAPTAYKKRLDGAQAQVQAIINEIPSASRSW